MREARYAVDRRVAAPPDAVLAALADAAARTRRRDIPPALQRGVSGLRCKVRGARFNLRLDERSEGSATDVQGWVVPAGEGQSRVQASAADDRGAGWGIAVFLALALGIQLSGGEGAGWMAGIAAFLALITIIRHAAGAVDEPQAGYLIQWLNEVLDTLPAPGPPDAAPASGESPPRTEPSS